MKYATVSEARKRILSLAEESEGTVLTRNGQPVAVFMPIGEYRAMRAMMKLSARPDLMEQVMAGNDRVLRGDLEGFVELEPKNGAAAL